MTESVKCIDCLHLRLRDNPKMAGLGFGNCASKPMHKFQSVVWARVCERFRFAGDESVKTRVEYYEKRGIT